jgi:hypothetical protein
MWAKDIPVENRQGAGMWTFFLVCATGLWPFSNSWVPWMPVCPAKLVLRKGERLNIPESFRAASKHSYLPERTFFCFSLESLALI